MSSLWRRWVALWAHREPATALAIFRIAVAAITTWTFVDMVRTDVVAPVWLHVDHGGVKPLLGRQWLIEALGGPVPEVVWPLVWLAIACGTVVTLGLPWLTNPAALVLNQVCVALFSLHHDAGGGHDRIITNCLWLLVFARSTATLSVAARLRTGSWWSDERVPAWPRYLVVVQLALIYGTTGWQKLGAEWFPWGGLDAVYRSLLLTSWARWDLSWIAWLYPLTQVATAVSWLFESLFPVLLLAHWWRATRTRPGRLRAWANRVDLRVPFALIGLGMHGILWATMNLGPFSFITLACYVCLWHPDELRRWLRGRGPYAETPPGSGYSAEPVSSSP